MKYAKELEVALELAQKASKAIVPFYDEGMSVEHKNDGTPLTNADLLSNEIIQEGLLKKFPNDGIVSEELESIEGERIWYLDPIDGTKGFVSHSDQFAIHIGLVNNLGKPVLGVVYKPLRDEYYYATQGGGAYRVSPNGFRKELKVGAVDSKNLVLCTNTKFLRSDLSRKVQEEVNFKEIWANGGQGLRMMMVAEGTADAHFANYPTWCKAWDMCAPQAIVEEAGGIVCNLNGKSLKYNGQTEIGEYFIVTKTEELRDYLCGKINGIIK
jgi:3'(2'), 5'-bisphosphate nucleotidase